MGWHVPRIGTGFQMWALISKKNGGAVANAWQMRPLGPARTWGPVVRVRGPVPADGVEVPSPSLDQHLSRSIGASGHLNLWRPKAPSMRKDCPSLHYEEHR